ncbi:MAG TPA: glycosyltransferase [Candidatus Paceibacterota bacterium]|nr:glycosyltransferase [Candidatus Paceibacterota bacterium]
MEKRKKILYVITKSNWGGAQKYVYDLATSLPADQFESVVVFGGSGPLAEKLALAGVRTASISTLTRDVSILGDAKSFFGLLSVIRKERPDIVHVNSSKVGGLGALAGRLLGVRNIIFTCHGWPWNEERNAASLALIRFLSWLTVMLSHRTIAVSGRDFHDGVKMPFSKNKIVLVHNGIREPDFMAQNMAFLHIQEAAKAVGVEIGDMDFLIGTIGELHANKGYEYLIRAFSKTDASAKLAIMGEGEKRAELTALIKELALEKRIALLGFVEGAPRYLAAFKAFALTSIKEGLPYVVIEAGFAGLPIVATNVGGVKEIIDDMRSGILVQTRKPDEIAEGLELLRTEREKGLEFGRVLREKVSGEFSLASMIKKTIAVYEGQ